jgi:hypothetical protein
LPSLQQALRCHLLDTHAVGNLQQGRRAFAQIGFGMMVAHLL